jgi:Fur family ferric uptake transcriptional regulator
MFIMSRGGGSYPLDMWIGREYIENENHFQNWCAIRRTGGGGERMRERNRGGHGQGGGPWWRDRFEQENVRFTSGRDAVIRVLRENEGHLSAADIFVKAHEFRPDIGLSTVYRTLEILDRMGTLRRFDGGDGRTRYELRSEPEGRRPHHHLVCVRCRKVLDCPDPVEGENELLERIGKKLEKSFGFTITDHMIRFYGICAECRADGIR